MLEAESGELMSDRARENSAWFVNNEGILVLHRQKSQRVWGKKAAHYTPDSCLVLLPWLPVEAAQHHLTLKAYGDVDIQFNRPFNSRNNSVSNL